MDEELSLEQIKKEYHGTLTSYLIGLFASLILTIISFYLVWTSGLRSHTLLYTIIGLAILQATVQLRFFMHLGKEDSPRWESISFFFMLTCLIIIVIGSLWIMYDLNNRVMSGMDMQM
jgi:cytochrome o ubiquinol oxidase operon protein cyoD